jgi:hypothetical protein
MSGSQYTYKRQELMKEKSKTNVNNKKFWEELIAYFP